MPEFKESSHQMNYDVELSKIVLKISKQELDKLENSVIALMASQSTYEGALLISEATFDIRQVSFVIPREQCDKPRRLFIGLQWYRTIPVRLIGKELSYTGLAFDVKGVR
jgi:hypothetical protein